MASARNGNLDIWYEVTGQGDPVALIGGFGILHEQFHLATPILAKHFKVINWHYRGAGNSDRVQSSNDCTVSSWADDLRAVLDDAGIEKAHVWATSTGSMIGVHFAARYRDRVSSLTTYPYFKTAADLRRVYQAYQVIFDVFGYAGITRILSWIGLPEERLNSPEGTAFAQWEGEVLERMVSPEAFNRFCQAYEYADLTADLPRLKDLPVMLLLGEDGPLGMKAPLVAALLEEFQRRAPHAVVRTIPGAGGTYCPMEKPEETTKHVIDFLQGLR